MSDGYDANVSITNEVVNGTLQICPRMSFQVDDSALLADAGHATLEADEAEQDDGGGNASHEDGPTECSILENEADDDAVPPAPRDHSLGKKCAHVRHSVLRLCPVRNRLLVYVYGRNQYGFFCQTYQRIGKRTKTRAEKTQRKTAVSLVSRRNSRRPEATTAPRAVSPTRL